MGNKRAYLLVLMVMVLFSYSGFLFGKSVKDDKKDECSRRSCIQAVKDFIRSYIIVIDPGHGEIQSLQAQSQEPQSFLQAEQQSSRAAEQLFQLFQNRAVFSHKPRNLLFEGFWVCG